jgi:ribosome maturation factor RimP
MHLEQEITRIVESILEKEYFVVDVQIKQLKEKKRVTVLLDGDAGVNIDVCAKVSRSLGDYIEQLNLIETAYNLEVSSPGVDNPLKFFRQYPQHIGRNLLVSLKNGTQLEGTLEAAENGHLTIEEKKGKGKKIEKITHRISFEDVVGSKVLISFK